MPEFFRASTIKEKEVLKMYGRKWKPSKAKAREFTQKMDEIANFCIANGIEQSRAGDSYYFNICGKSYRVSNHTVEASNRSAFDEFGQQTRELYHEGGRLDNVIYIQEKRE